jgi:hypothetical protein
MTNCLSIRVGRHTTYRVPEDPTPPASLRWYIMACHHTDPSTPYCSSTAWSCIT